MFMSSHHHLQCVWIHSCIRFQKRSMAEVRTNDHSGWLWNIPPLLKQSTLSCITALWYTSILIPEILLISAGHSGWIHFWIRKLIKLCTDLPHNHYLIFDYHSIFDASTVGITWAFKLLSQLPLMSSGNSQWPPRSQGNITSRVVVWNVRPYKAVEPLNMRAEVVSKITEGELGVRSEMGIN